METSHSRRNRGAPAQDPGADPRRAAVALDRLSIELDTAVDHALAVIRTEPDSWLLVPSAQLISRALDRLEQALFEFEIYGRSDPPLLPLTRRAAA